MGFGFGKRAVPQDPSARNNTALSPEDEAAFKAWVAQTGRDGDLQDYDLRGAWKADAKEAGNGHLPDTWKKPNHPTFSDESMYASAKQPGGTWAPMPDGSWTYFASPTNLQGRDPSDLLNYFQAREQGNTVVLPRKGFGFGRR